MYVIVGISTGHNKWIVKMAKAVDGVGWVIVCWGLGPLAVLDAYGLIIVTPRSQWGQVGVPQTPRKVVQQNKFNSICSVLEIKIICTEHKNIQVQNLTVADCCQTVWGYKSGYRLPRQRISAFERYLGQHVLKVQIFSVVFTDSQLRS